MGNMTIQVEKESFYHNLNKLSGNGLQTIDFREQANVDIYEQINIVKSV